MSLEQFLKGEIQIHTNEDSEIVLIDPSKGSARIISGPRLDKFVEKAKLSFKANLVAPKDFTPQQREIIDRFDKIEKKGGLGK